ncbi:MAG TPA: phosphoribosylformylglycinamidine cyclo-ligase [Nitrolancea sp.]
MEPETGSYRSAGVDIDAAEAAKDEIAKRVAATHNVSVLRGVGHFGGFFRAPKSDGEVVLVSSADSVGTKVLVAALAGHHYPIGHDLVNHCVNDILACGARPLFFLDYYATPKLDRAALREIIQGMTDACEEAGCALIGGETAQLPGIYQPGTYDLAGFVVGAVDESRIVDGSRIQDGDVVLGIPSVGLHTNGYSLARSALGLDGDPERGRAILTEAFNSYGIPSLTNALLAPHRSYICEISPLLDLDIVKGMAHITGGGIAGNVSRVIPNGLCAEFDLNTWEPHPIFQLIQQRGAISGDEMYKVFNMGLGFVVVVSPPDVNRALEEIEDGRIVGRIIATPDETKVRIVRNEDGWAAS